MGEVLLLRKLSLLVGTVTAIAPVTAIVVVTVTMVVVGDLVVAVNALSVESQDILLGNVLMKVAEGVVGMVAEMIGTVAAGVVAEVVMVLIEMEIDLGGVAGILVAMVEAIVTVVTVLDRMTVGVLEVSDLAEERCGGGGGSTGCELVENSFSLDIFPSQCFG